MNPNVDTSADVQEPSAIAEKKLILCWAFNVDGKEVVPASSLLEFPFPKDDKELISIIEKFASTTNDKMLAVRKNIIGDGGKIVSFYPQLAWECAQHLEEAERRKIMQFILKRG